MAVLVQEASKATTVDGGFTRFSFPIEKSEDTQDINPVDGTPDLQIWGKATDGTLDSDLQVVDPDASLRWIKTWFDTKANIRMGHDPKRPVGRGMEVDGHYVKALIADPTAKHLIRSKVLNDFSVGIMNPDVRRGDPKFRHLDPAGKAVNGVITDRSDGLTGLGEISVVDRGANFGSSFQLVKAASDGAPEWVGKMVGGDLLTKEAAPEMEDATVSVDLPKDVSLSITPGDLAKLLKHRQEAEERQEAVYKAETDVYKRDIDTATRRRLASEGKALPDGSYPIETAGDLQNAAILARSGHGNVAAARKLIARRAQALGVANPLDDDDKVKKGADSTTAAETPDTDAVETDDTSAVKGAAPVLHHDDDEDDDTDSDADTMDEPKAGKRAKAMKAPCKGCGKKVKPKVPFCPGCGKKMAGAPDIAKKGATPGDGVTGEHTDPVPAHREPDGPPMEMLERDAHMQDGDEASEMAAAMRHKSLGVPPPMGVLHDLTCPAYDLAAVAKCHPHASLDMVVSVPEWQAKALEIAASAPLDEARKAAQIWQHALTVKGTPLDLATDLRAEAHKAFRDANPGPGTFPTPGEISARRFNRPYISAGHAAPSPGQDAPNHGPTPPEHIAASQFDRDYITPGHASESPGNGGSLGSTAPEVPGVPSAVSYTAIQRDNASQAMTAMHDHVAQSFPDLCPMHGPGHAGEQPSHAKPVPAGVGGPVPHSAGKAEAAAEDAGVAARKLRRSLEKAVFRGEIGLDDARAQLGLEPLAPAAVTKAASAAVLDPDVVKAAVADATAPLIERLATQGEALARQAQVLDAIASQPDPAVTAYRGTALIKQASAPPAGELTVSKRAERAQDMTISALFDDWRNSPDPGRREAAWADLKKFHGLNMQT